LGNMGAISGCVSVYPVFSFILTSTPSPLDAVVSVLATIFYIVCVEGI
jgi:hypothetical protein